MKLEQPLKMSFASGKKGGAVPPSPRVVRAFGLGSDTSSPLSFCRRLLTVCHALIEGPSWGMA